MLALSFLFNQRLSAIWFRISQRNISVYDKLIGSLRSPTNHKPSNLLGLSVAEPTHILELSNSAISTVEGMVHSIKNRDVTTIRPIEFDNISNELCRVADWAECVRHVHPEHDIRKAADNAYLDICSYIDVLNSDLLFYKKLEELKKLCESSKLDSISNPLETEVLMDSLLKDFENSGIHLGDRVDEFLNIKNSLLLNSENFVKNCGRKNLNQSVDEKQIYLLNQILFLRFRLAQILGFQNYSTYALHRTMVGSPETAMEFLSEILCKIKDFQNQLPLDLASAMNNTKNEFKNLDIQKTSHIAKFVPLTTLFGVIEHILENTFDVKLLVVDESDFTFSNQVIKMEVCSNNKMIGELYFDIFPRKNKPFLNCHYTLRGRKTEPVFQHPSVYLLLNPPLLEQYSTPGMSYESAIMVMHELGHCFHSIFYNGSYQHLSGTRCSTDIAEIPSMLFEKFFTDPQVKNMLFINNNLKSDVDTSYLLKAETIYRTTVDSIVDLSINSSDDPDFVKIINRVIKERNLVLQVNPTIHYQYFSHLIHYPSKYYSYLWAEGCANMIWCELFQRNALNQHAGDVFKRCFLQKGAMVESEDFIESMLCKKFSSKTLSNYSLY